MTEEQLIQWRKQISDLVTEFSKNRLSTTLYMLCIWVYEYLESYVVNNTKLGTNLKSVKDTFPEYHTTIIMLFNLRSNLVHKPFKFNEVDVSNIVSRYKDIDDMLARCGFGDIVVEYVYHALVSEV